MTPGTYDIKVIRGVTWERVFTWKQPDGWPRDLTGWSGSAKFEPQGSNVPTLTKIAVIDGPAGMITITLSDAETAAFTWEVGEWELELTDPSPKIWRLIEGQVNVRE